MSTIILSREDHDRLEAAENSLRDHNTRRSEQLERIGRLIAALERSGEAARVTIDYVGREFDDGLGRPREIVVAVTDAVGDLPEAANRPEEDR